MIWIKENWRTAIELVAVALVAFAIMMGASAYWDHRTHAAADALYAAMRLTTDSPEQIARLEEIASGYSRTPAGQRAMMQLGDYYLNQKDYDRASARFKSLSGRAKSRPILLIAALHKLADVELARGDPKSASELYLKAASDPHNKLGSISRFRAAASLERAGEFDVAAGLYRQIMSDSEGKPDDRAVRDLSEERLIWLKTSGQIS